MDKQYKVFEETFKGHKIIAIWEIDPAGNKVGKYPLISFGSVKAKVVLDKVDAIRAIVAQMR